MAYTGVGKSQLGTHVFANSYILIPV